MNSRMLRAFFVALLAAAGVLVTTSGAVGATDIATRIRPATDQQVVDIYDDIARTGVMTATQRQELSARPDADQLIDPTSATFGEKTVAAPELKAAAAGVQCTKKDRYVVFKSLILRQKSLEYHFTMAWCYNGSKITNTPQYDHYIVSYVSGAVDKGFTNNPQVVWTRANHYSAAITLQGHVEQCIFKYGCISSANARSDWGLYGNGYYTYSGFKK